MSNVVMVWGKIKFVFWYFTLSLLVLLRSFCCSECICCWLRAAGLPQFGHFLYAGALQFPSCSGRAVLPTMLRAPQPAPSDERSSGPGYHVGVALRSDWSSAPGRTGRAEGLGVAVAMVSGAGAWTPLPSFLLSRGRTAGAAPAAPTEP